MFHQSHAVIRTASPWETQPGQSTAGSSRRPTNGQSTGRSLFTLEQDPASPRDSKGLEKGLVNGHVAGHVASSEPNSESLEPQNISRARIENHQTFAQRPKVSMTRSKTNYEPEHTSSIKEPGVEEHGELRHGWEDEYNSSEFLGQLNSVYVLVCFDTSMESGWLILSVGFLHVLHR